VELEVGAPPAWEPGLVRRGHEVRHLLPGANVGHAHVIVVTAQGTYAGASDARAGSGAAVGI